MTLSPVVHPEAEDEFSAAVAWYWDRDQGFAARLRIAVRTKVNDLLQWPESGPVYPGWTEEPAVRHAKVAGSSYRVVYFVEGETLTVLAVAHTSREPGYWRHRLDR